MDTTSIEGQWWVFGLDSAPWFGRLVYSQEELRLEAKRPQDLTISDTMLQSVERPKDVERVIVGRNEHNQPVTLFGCNGMPAFSAGLRSLTIDALAAVNGLQLSDWTEPALRAVSVNVAPLPLWLGREAVLRNNKADGSETLSLPHALDVSVELSDDIEFRICCSTSTSWGQARAKFEQDGTVWLQFQQPRSLEEVSSIWVPWVTRLFSLLIGTPIRADGVRCYRERYHGDDAGPLEPSGELIRHGGRAPTRADEIHPRSMITRWEEIRDRFESIIRRWAEVSERLQPVVDLFAVAAFNQTLHTEAEFLFLVQALEVYHARSAEFTSKLVANKDHAARVRDVVATAPTELQDWVRRTLAPANYKHLDERLAEILLQYKTEVTIIFGDDPALAEKIRYTRNYLTHHFPDPNAAKLLSGGRLVEVSWRLRILLWVCLLKEIDLPAVAVERLIRRYGEVDFVSLD